MVTTAYIALGSNLGDRRGYLDRALAALRSFPGIWVQRVSPYYETAPVGGPAGQGAYINATAELRTDLTSEVLLQALLEIERHLGRVRAERDGPRTIDLDLLLFGDLQRADPQLTLPHPRLHERRFVLEPLRQIAPLLVHPILKRTIADLLTELTSSEPAPRQLRELEGLRAVVTGSTGGIGKAIALELAEAGADVLIHGRRSKEAALAVAAQVRARGVTSHAVLADLADVEACQQLVEGVWEDTGRVDIWINNAGADTLTGDAAIWPFERKLAQLLAVDVTATMVLSRAIGQRMKEAGSGTIVNIGWDQADTGMAGDSGQLFGAVKSAVMAFTKSLAVTLAPTVRVNCVAPGWIRTAWGEVASQAWQKRAVAEAPLARWGLPQDVAAAVKWLVSPASGFITGQTIRVNGGAVR